jgi:iron complex transport system ATP-binding protein
MFYVASEWGTTVINTLGLTVVKSGRYILNEIDVSITSGSWTCLVGPNGAGKTTFLKVLLGVEPYLGSATDSGIQIYKNQDRNVAYVPQNPHIPTNMRVYEYVLLGRARIDGWGVESRRVKERVLETLEIMGIFGMQDQLMDRLSGGEVQRAVIARALVQQPDLILLDEPTSALDLHNQIGVLNCIESLKSSGVTIISTMHDITLAAMYANEIAVMKNGKVLVHGKTAPVIESNELKSAFDHRIDVYKLEGGSSIVMAIKDPQ